MISTRCLLVERVTGTASQILGLDLELPNGMLSFPAQIFGLCVATASVVTIAMSILAVRSRKPD
jgi:hypothetical protein